MVLLILIQVRLFSCLALCSIPNCLICSSHSSYLCINCQIGYFSSLSGCIPSNNINLSQKLIENCLEYTSERNCLACQAGFTIFRNACKPDCPEDCLCFEPNVCIDEGQFFSNQIIETQRKLEGCENCVDCSAEGYCSTCNSYYYGYNGICIKCGDFCSNCEDENTCITCDTGYSINSGFCKLICSEGCSDCQTSDNCKTCYSGYYLSSSNCISCGTGCKSCDSQGICQECETNYKWENDKCVLSCSNGCKECKDSINCYKCKKGFYLYSGYCNNCISNCRECSSYSTCSTCKSGYYYSGGICKNESERTRRIVIIVAPTVSVFAIVIIIFIIIYFIRRRQRKNIKIFFKEQNEHAIENRNFMDLNLQNLPQNYPSPQIPTYYNPVNYPQTEQFNRNIPIIIDYTNFLQLVPIVNLDKNKYKEQNTCIICYGLFSADTDTRILPCDHAFHGKCVYEVVAIGAKKYCPVCNRQYG